MLNQPNVAPDPNPFRQATTHVAEPAAMYIVAGPGTIVNSVEVKGQPVCHANVEPLTMAHELPE